MFRFYSFLSPNGVPEPAALALAQPIFHEWSRTDAGNLLLEVLGLDVDPLFHSDGQSIYLLQPTRIFRVSAPPETNRRVFFHYAKTPGDTTTEMALVLPANNDEAWRSHSGRAVDLFRKDQTIFGPLGRNPLTLPVWTPQVSLSGPVRFPLLTPDGFLSFLQATDGDLNVAAERRGAAWSLTLSTRRRNFVFLFEAGTVFEQTILLNKPKLFDGLISLPIRLDA